MTLKVFAVASLGLLLLPMTDAEAAECWDKKPAEKIDQPGDCFFTFTIENDLFGAGSDKHYTNGWRAALYNQQQRSPEFLEFVEEYLPLSEINGSTSVHYSMGQNLYTPEDIAAKAPDPEDRPYAGFLYGSIGYSTDKGTHVDDVELTLGVVGPWAFGEETQTFVHEIIDSTIPKGWGRQLDTEPGLILAAQRRWTHLPAAKLAGLDFKLVPHAGGALGNIYTYAGTGATLHIGPSRYGLQSAPLRVRPAIPGKGEFYTPKDELAWSVFAGIEARAMGRNIFLDGNSFKSGPSVEKEVLVGDLNGGLTLTYGWLRTSYTLNWRSKEFDGQDENTLFGAISVGVRF